ncbi:hypothetical protein SASPL_122853 [Salvia splendens]|uniref:Uncharacterized protein n=1 Tax=Salvia splendens TaxID=180675 RepID=A0A8X8ZRK2_SALSN|nr:hypothetical protein SASPL_122853 [Salvia splendens]
MKFPSTNSRGGRGDDASRLAEAFTRTRVRHLNQMIDKIGAKLDDEEAREKELDQAAATRERWWEMPVEDLDKEQVEQLIAFMRNLQSELHKMH